MTFLTLALLAMQPAAGSAAPPAPALTTTPPKWRTEEGDVAIRDFRFGSGEVMPTVRIHYTTLGTPRRNAKGEIDNAVMVLHGTGGSGKQFLQPQFAEELYGPGQPLDIDRYYIILPDNVGHGGSSKPSDGLRMKFPRYDYVDMVELQYRMLTQGLGIRKLRLIMGTSMGCMHGFIWGETYPDFAQALMPLACQPVEIAGLNRMWRQMLIDGIKSDPAWMGGEYKSQPKLGLRTAASLSVIAGGAPLNLQKNYPTREAAASYARERIERDIASRDANDMIYQFESSRTYNPWPGLEKITAPMTWINSADDFINPRNLPYPAEALKRMPNARFRLIAESDETRGHGTHTWAVHWKADLVDLLARSGG
ncbi:alpha/beta fold hydrolase [Sphingopyxis sp. JAI128]|uniref:alpha/beta fold hydrolase n=1 Tax=Sphingopyxis sp. JAI128 TaxID=2723066 RepID=UPI0016097C24|nr:alpha/beta fold hydrolase [Sphingopyxis sp. JAI128]MBB6426215.1 homoserine O-acetyltransferase [Sphingopyxis sp. JAI128]